MNKHYEHSQIKKPGIAYLFWFLLGAHYIYLERWGTQIIFWISFGGLGLWAIYDLFTMSNKVKKYNKLLFDEIERMEQIEKIKCQEQIKAANELNH